MENKRTQFSLRSPSRVPYRTELLPCVECLIGKQKKPILFQVKVTEPSSIPYRSHSACAKRAAYPPADPPPVTVMIPVPDTRSSRSRLQHVTVPFPTRPSLSVACPARRRCSAEPSYRSSCARPFSSHSLRPRTQRRLRRRRLPRHRAPRCSLHIRAPRHDRCGGAPALARCGPRSTS